MAVKKTGLGKGLDALFSTPIIEETVNNQEELVKKLKINEIEPNKEQARKLFDEEAIEDLASSIKEYGVIQPIIVSKKDNYYEIIAGERRWRASKKAGLSEIPAIVRDDNDQRNKEISLIENIQREDLNPIEEAQAYKRLLTEFNLKQDEVAERVAKSRTAVTNSMRLLKLCDNVQQMIIDGMISTGHARALISIEDPEQQYTVAQQIFDEKLSVRDVEKLVKNLNQPPKVKKAITTDKSLEAVYQNIEENLKQKLSTKVSITPKGNGTGKIEIEFYSHEDLEKLMDLLSK